MRRGFCGAHPVVLSCLQVSCRAIHRHHSPDRTFSQEIQDRQNTFDWSRRHIFRPHQHFSYDPSNWSRPLEEKTKHQHQLSLVERVKLAQEHEAERRANKAAIQHASASAVRLPPEVSASTTDADDVPFYFFSLDDTQSALAATYELSEADDTTSSNSSWDAVALQELVEELQRLQHLLYSRRYTGNASLARRARYEREFHVVLQRLFDRLRGAVLGETITVDAAVFGWFTLLRHVEPLAEALAATTGAAAAEGEAETKTETETAVVRCVFASLQHSLLRPMEYGGDVHRAAATGTLSLEALVELLAVAASPFVRNCSDVFQEVIGVSQTTLEEYAAWVASAAQQRAQESADADEAEQHAALREWVDPTHLDAWAAAVKHLHRRGCSVDRFVPGLMLQVTHAALYVRRTLEGVTGVTLRGRVRESLLRSRAAPSSSSVPLSKEEDVQGMQKNAWAPKAIVLDVTAPPRGVQSAPTECDDVSCTLSASAHVLELGAHLESTAAAGVVPDETRQRLVTECLRMTAQAPNYDLDGAVVVRWACTLLQSGLLLNAATDAELHVGRPEARGSFQEGIEDAVRLSLRLLLLLSRLSFSDVVERPALGRLVLRISQWPEPEWTETKERAEWRRLRGLVMRTALDRLTTEDLTEAATEVDGVSTWVETLAFGEYDGLVPLELWRNACEHLLLPSSSSFAPTSSEQLMCTADTARALLLLCARYVARRDVGRGAVAAAASANLQSPHTAQWVAKCVGVLLDKPNVAEALMQSADAWEAVAGEVPEPLLPLLSVMQAVVRRETTQPRVMHF
jgi:hypothetical protein